MAYDMAVANEAFKTAAGLGASSKVMLSLFEAGIVESGFTNSRKATDHDSVGFLQQRPSQGWGTVDQIMNVAYATKSYITRAKANEAKYATAGQLAQSVQRSAYPDKYDKVEKEAVALLAKVKGGLGSDPGFYLPPDIGDALGDLYNKYFGGGGSGIDLDGGLVEAVRAGAGALKGIGEGVGAFAKLAELGMKLALPSNMIRAVMGVAGIVFIFIGIAQLGREVRRT